MRRSVGHASGGSDRRPAERKMRWDDKTLFWCVITSTVAILLALSTLLIDTPKEAAEKELAYLADEYYITYLYPRLIGGYQPEEILPDYEQSGVSTTYLRQLLLYNDGEHADSEVKFTNANYNCDTNLTGVRYFPRAPWGPRDYEVSYIWHCKED